MADLGQCEECNSCDEVKSLCGACDGSTGIKALRTRVATLENALALYRSMALGGESESDQSRAIYEKAMQAEKGGE